MNSKEINLISIIGPTASGKTTFAANLAFHLNGEIISADSRQVYRNMDIGTGKDLSEYKIDGKIIPYHLINIVDPGYEYNVYEYQKDFLKSFQSILKEKALPVLCGGSGMYIEAVLNQYELISVPVNNTLREELEKKELSELAVILSQYKIPHNTTDNLSKKRAIRAIEINEFYKKNVKTKLEFPELNYVLFGISSDREIRRKKITERLKFRLENGMIEEAVSLIDSGLSHEKLMFYGLEYKYLSLYLRGIISYDEMFLKLNIAIHQFAKRQMTWFRRMEKRGFQIHWLDAEMSIQDKITESLKILEPYHLKEKGK